MSSTGEECCKSLDHLPQVTLIYHKKLDDEWKAAAVKLRTALAESPSSREDAVTIIGRSHKQKVELDRDFVIETMEVAGREYIYKQASDTFGQHGNLDAGGCVLSTCGQK